VCVYQGAAENSKGQTGYTMPDSPEKCRDIQYEDGIASMRYVYLSTIGEIQ